MPCHAHEHIHPSHGKGKGKKRQPKTTCCPGAVEHTFPDEVDLVSFMRAFSPDPGHVFTCSDADHWETTATTAIAATNRAPAVTSGLKATSPGSTRSPQGPKNRARPSTASDLGTSFKMGEIDHLHHFQHSQYLVGLTRFSFHMAIPFCDFLC